MNTMGTDGDIEESLNLGKSRIYEESQVAETAADASKTETKAINQGIMSVLQRSLTHSSSRVKDCLMSIANRGEECELSTFCKNLSDLEIML